jgi:hypothetical protein
MMVRVAAGRLGVSLDPAKTVEAVVLPGLGSVTGYNPARHIFAIAIG